MMGRMWAVLQAVNSEVEPALDGLQINSKQFFLMAGLTNGASPGDLARLMTVPPSTITSLVKQHEALGFVSRQIASEDLRQVALSLTATGRRAVLKGEAVMNGAFGARLAALSKDELAQLDSILDKLIAPPPR